MRRIKESDLVRGSAGNTQGMIPVRLLLAPKVRLHYDDLEEVAKKFLGVFAEQTVKDVKGDSECFNDYIARLSSDSIVILALPLVSQTEFTDDGVIQVKLDLSPLLEATCPSGLYH